MSYDDDYDVIDAIFFIFRIGISGIIGFLVSIIPPILLLTYESQQYFGSAISIFSIFYYLILVSINIFYNKKKKLPFKKMFCLKDKYTKFWTLFWIGMGLFLSCLLCFML